MKSCGLTQTSTTYVYNTIIESIRNILISMSKNLLPKHIAIIPDGNRRWAKSRGKSALEGHKFAIEQTMSKLFDTIQELEIPFCTIWLLSPENFVKRSKGEVKNLLFLLKFFLKKKIKELDRKGIRLKVIGNMHDLPKDIQDELNKAIETTKSNSKTTITFAINYGGRDEIIRTINKILKNNKSDSLNSETFSEYLDTKEIPDPDLIIRTGGEKRTSGFLPWQSEYSEYIFLDTLFPDFTQKALRDCVDEYLKRMRRFGK
ncbi:di-trans,poly-cis-decaprenylcistransferase [Candidatus Roizmanbacteria bacterium CG11_big_fil_rev_8_21_14_0_20_36_8]|uniref:Isoprenyl transferase n=2 Tax=Candidatus Roizmaniibacteriota TaxID=1752723 RepID=A0A2M6ITL0_9BACT|nr:MAG: di-trans,poly-cis-decaprenylcistransferase [Candidatus Roizmanbacteria bacterium CG11_big_fil_rev_8_21_14_0_20_36_8]PIZ65007.1 MAG: di-trans,poly-cis-decaprenylcistransferase [Candidatus Roizmanbacteria bacterium CG_4_10_14_0_2_um_filter_36_9]